MPTGALLVVLTVIAGQSTAQPTLEYDVKAAFVLNFVRYVEWPAGRRTPPLQVCMLDSNPFGSRLEEVVRGEQWAGGAIDVRLVADVRRAAGCHVIYVPESANARFAAGISALAGVPVLTIGEHEQFLQQGGMIRLFVEDNRVRFSINQRAADTAGVTISSRLLRLARAVIGAAEAP